MQIVEPHMHSAVHGADRVTPLEPRLHVAHLVKVAIRPGRTKRVRVAGELIVLAFAQHRLERRLRTEHAALHGVVRSLDAWNIEEARGVPDQCAAGKD